MICLASRQTNAPELQIDDFNHQSTHERMLMNRNVIVVCLCAAGISIGAHAAETAPAAMERQVEVHQENYVPGLGEIMGSTQMRHAKLWFAGKAGNWDLASYELDEIREGMDDAVKYHPVFKKDAPIADILDKFTAQPLNDLESAIKAKDSVKFRKSYDRLTRACNACHQAASQGFIVIKRPGA